jgi:predicted porin
VLHACNGKDEFLTPVIGLCSGVWFNTFNFPKTEVGSGKTGAPVQTLENLEMKKTLVAIAALAAFGAQAQSTVEAFGIVDIGYGVQQDKASDGSLVRKSAGVKDGALAGNRLGFRGTEDLGGGSAAVFWLESGISPSTGSLLNERDSASGHVSSSRTSQTTRQAYVGLKNVKLGEVRVGYQNTLLYDLTSQRHAISIHPETRGGEAHNYVTPNTRATAVTYFSPVINNVEYSLQWAGAQDKGLTDANPTGTTAGNAYSSAAAGATYQANVLGLGAVYKNGPLVAGLAHFQTKVTGASPVASSQFPGFATTGGATGLAAGNNAAVTNGEERLTSGTQLAAKYDFGKFKLAANYGVGKVQGTTTATAALSDRNQYELGLSVPVGATDLIASYGKGNTKAGGGATEAHIKYVGVGAIHNLSKRTRLYALYGTQTDSQLSDSTSAAKLSGTRVGISHAF